MTTKTAAEMVGKLNEALNYIEILASGIVSSVQVQRARLDSVQAGEVVVTIDDVDVTLIRDNGKLRLQSKQLNPGYQSDQTEAALKAIDEISRYVGILTAGGTLPSEHSRVIASCVKDARFALKGILPKEQPGPEVVTVEENKKLRLAANHKTAMEGEPFDADIWRAESFPNGVIVRGEKS